MSQSPQGQSRVCPTRIDDRPVLFAHRVSAAGCQGRQRGSYHKCYTCVFNNARAGQNRKAALSGKGAPTESGGVDRPQLVAARAE